MLERPFTLEKVKAAVFELGGDKAPGLDGFPIQFFKQFWDTIKLDIFKLCQDFYDGSANLERINWENIALILKIEAWRSQGTSEQLVLLTPL